MALEETMGGPQRISIGDQSFLISQKSVTFLDQELAKLGTLSRENASFPPVVVQGAKGIMSLLDRKASENSASPAIDALWFDFSDVPSSSSDWIFLNIPINVDTHVSNIIAMLKMSQGEGKAFYRCASSGYS